MSRLKLTLEPNNSWNGHGIYNVRNRKKELLGRIFYTRQWKEWTYEQCPGVIMSADCLQEVVEMIKAPKPMKKGGEP